MSEESLAKQGEVDVDLMVAEVESGARQAVGFAGKFILGLAFTWSLFQLYIASPLPYTLAEATGINQLVLPSQATRQIHLAFAFVLAMLAYPLFKSSPRDKVPWYDWALSLVAAGSTLYLFYFRLDISGRAGLPTTMDLVISTLGMLSLALAVYRSLGLPLVIVASVFVFYVFFGDQSFMPEAIQWKGASYGKALWHFWMQTEGVFGVALKVSASMIFLFVLFGSLLEKAGAGNFFIKLAFSLLGHFRGGPAKAAVIASALSGLYSGSSIANVVTTGTFTIPLMKRTGFTPEKAGAVEVASSTNGQLMPPVMGAAAFLISDDFRIYRGFLSRTDQECVFAGAYFLYCAGLYRSYRSPETGFEGAGETVNNRQRCPKGFRGSARLYRHRHSGRCGLLRARLDQGGVSQHDLLGGGNYIQRRLCDPAVGGGQASRSGNG